MREWFNIAEEGERVELDVYGPIGKSWYDDDSVGAKQVLDAIKAANGRPIDLHVNSEGGSAFDGFAIYTTLRDSDSEVTAYIDGLAASAASYLVMAADRIVMSDVAWMMIHNASTMAWGNKHDLAKEIETLDGIDKTISKAYAKRGGKTAEEFAALMDEETWLSAEDALEYGLVDEVSEAYPVAAKLDLCGEGFLDRAPEVARAAIRSLAGDNEGNIHSEDNGDDPQEETAEPPVEVEEETEGETKPEDEPEPIKGQPLEDRGLFVVDGRIFRACGERKEGEDA